MQWWLESAGTGTEQPWYECDVSRSLMRGGALLLVTILAAGCRGCTQGAGPLVAFLGDSLTASGHLREEEFYPALLRHAVVVGGQPIRVLNAGRSGDTTAQGLARLPAVLRRHPDVVVVALGINDALRGLSLIALEATLDRIVVTCQANGARTLLVGVRIPRRPDEARSRALDDLFPRVAAARRIPLVPDLLAGVAGHPEFLMPDLLHPNAAGQKRLAENVRPQLELLLAEWRHSQ